MSIELVREKRETAFRIGDYLPEIEYGLAISPAEQNEVFKLRYKAYLRAHSIDPDPSERFTDYYDRMENCHIFGVYADDELLSSIRIHVISKEHRKGVAVDVYPDILHPLIDQGNVIIDPTRFVCDQAAKRKYPELAFVTLRIPSMASLAFEADYCLATVRESHRSFYEHIFEAKVLSEPRPYPGLRQRLCLMQVDIGKVRDQLMSHHSAYHTTVEDWRMLFENARMAKQVGEVPPMQLQPALVN